MNKPLITALILITNTRLFIDALNVYCFGSIVYNCIFCAGIQKTKKNFDLYRNSLQLQKMSSHDFSNFQLFPIKSITNLFNNLIESIFSFVLASQTVNLILYNFKFFSINKPCRTPYEILHYSLFYYRMPEVIDGSCHGYCFWG